MLVIAKGYEPTFATKVDPLTGPLAVSLPKFDRPNLPANRRVQGRVIDPHGYPVIGAKIEENGVTRGLGTQYGGNKDFDPLAVTDENGEFLLTSKDPFESVVVRIEARGLAPTNVAGLNGAKGWLIKLQDGAAVRGRVVKDGRPLAGIGISLSDKNRLSGEFAGYFDTVTDDNGVFHYFCIPAVGDFVLTAKMESLRKEGMTAARTIRLAKDTETVDAGDLEVKPGNRVAGRVVLSDGKPLPAGSKLSISRESAWDSESMELGADGRFDIRNVPPESIHFGPRVKGYRLSLKNPSIDRLNRFGVMGTLNGDLMDFVLLLEPGEWRHPLKDDDASGFTGPSQPRDLPLRGVDPKTIVQPKPPK